jgi:hypothetical protein
MAMSNLSYDLLTVLQNKLEAVTAYTIYEKDCATSGDEQCRKLVADLKRDDERHIERLREEVVRLVKADQFR